MGRTTRGGRHCRLRTHRWEAATMSKRYLSTNDRGGGPMSSADGDAFSGLLKTSRTRCEARGGTCTGPGPTWTPVNVMKSDIPLEWPSRYLHGTRRTAQEHADPHEGQGGVLHTEEPGPSVAWLVRQSSGLERTPAPRLGHVRCWGTHWKAGCALL